MRGEEVEYASPRPRGSPSGSVVVNGKELPGAPKDEPSARSNSVRFEESSFPFSAQPGSTGPLSTTKDLTNGQLGDNVPISGKPLRTDTEVLGTTTPSERKSVQFANGSTEEHGLPATSTTASIADDEGDGEVSTRERQSSFFGRLKALASSSSGHARGPSTATDSDTPNGALSPRSECSELEGNHDRDDHDVAIEEVEEPEDVAVDLETPRPKKRRKPSREGTADADSSPSMSRPNRLENRFASFMRDSQSGAASKAGTHRPTGSSGRPHTTTDLPHFANGEGGLSEDEGRERVRSAWRRGLEGARGLTYSGRAKNEDDNSQASRPSHLRRLTGMAGSTLDGTTTGSPHPKRGKAERQATSSAQKWRQVKAGLKMLGQRKRDERTRVDHQKSAQLMAELLAGAPAALVFASMFQRDDHDHRRIPVLLEQIKIRIPESQIRNEAGGDRHLVFKIELEYGNGPARMQWTISRSLKDFVNLHAKYQAQSAADKVKHLSREPKTKSRMPRFPKSAFPYGRGIRGLWDNLRDDEDGDESEAPPTPGVGGLQDVVESPRTPFTPFTPNTQPTPLVPGGRGVAIPEPSTPSTTAPTKHKRRKSSVVMSGGLRRTSAGELGPLPKDLNDLPERQRELYQRRQRRKLEQYLQQMIRWLVFRADSTRLCKFLELSALAVRLSAEGSFQGKQGLLTIASKRKKEFKDMRQNPQAIQDLYRRHTPKWFLVRQSYVVCVDGPESLNPYDVFLVDSDFTTEKRKKAASDESRNTVAQAIADKAAEVPKPHTKHLILRIYNAERKLRMVAKTERQYLQFQESLNLMAASTIWAQKHRFESFAPVRNNVWCRWLVDGRDHMWQVSRAIDNAKDFVYIHDWWLSPELYMRRPAAISQKWRLDRLLQRKAQEGVKIFVIVYRNIESAIPIDSEYTKWSLLDLHENICIQRSPNQFRQNQFFWAHHEKLVVIDNMMAFVGGVDLCFGRWDDPCHTLTDDKLTGFETDHLGPRDSEHCQVWPGKDYSNPRVQDFYALDRPYEEMYDRTKVPRMPWHDIAMQLVGQPARDVGRHFVQRWNYVLRNRNPSRPTPVLIPPPEYEQLELEELGMTGTCQVQILRSCSPWSIGTPNKVEHSIMNAYCHLIEHSQHFVYIENQFFITSCTVEGTPIHNKIGDALFERILVAHDNAEQWHACIVIPLMPGFQNSVDSQDGTSVRLIMQCQFRSICRGETSIFGRLKARGIEPEEYIKFYSLRQWGKIGPKKCLTTEQLYIHAKVMVVDDRTVIIGSANINERSLLGSRDSEVAAVITDMKQIPSLMGGEPFEVGEFAHTLRKRLMREHLGIDVDAIYRRDQAKKEREEQDAEMERIYREDNEEDPGDYFSGVSTLSRTKAPKTKPNLEVISTSNTGTGLGGTTSAGFSGGPDNNSAPRQDKHQKKSGVELQHDLDVEGYGFDNMKALVDAGDIGLTDSFVDSRGREILLKRDAPDVYRIKSQETSEGRRSHSADRKKEDNPPVRPPYPTERMDTYTLGLPSRSQLPELPLLDDTDIGGPPLLRGSSLTGSKTMPLLAQTLRRPDVHEDCMTDPLAPAFYDSIWHQVAANNTRIYRQVFRCMPDSEVTDWKTYERFNEYNERFMQSQGLGSSKPRPSKGAPDKSGPPGSGGPALDAMSSAAGLVPDGRKRSKSVLSGFVEKLHPGSRASEDVRQTREDDEKRSDEIKNEGSPASRDSGVSSGPTAVPSPQPEVANEKDAQNDLEGAEEKDHNVKPINAAQEALTDEDVGGQRKAVHYDEKINEPPETTATQTATNSTAPQPSGSQKRRRRGATKSSARNVPEEVLSSEEAESLLKLVQGHLVLWPYDW